MPDSPAARLRDLEGRGVRFELHEGRVVFQQIEDRSLRSDALALVTQHHDWLRTVLEIGPERLMAIRYAVEIGRLHD